MEGGFMKVRGKCSTRAEIVARWFGIKPDDIQRQSAAQKCSPPIHLRGGQIVLVSGASGAGKSTLLRQLFRRYRRRAHWIDLQQIELPRVPVIDLLADYFGEPHDEAAILAALRALSRVGLGEVWTYLRRPCELSDGQRWRLRLAVGLARASEGLGFKVQGTPQKSSVGRTFLSARAGDRGHSWPSKPHEISGDDRISAEQVQGQEKKRPLSILAADEFAAPLDRVTALVVARALRKAVDRQPNLCAIVATTRDDLLPALAPDVHVRCDFGICHLFSKGDRHE